MCETALRFPWAKGSICVNHAAGSEFYPVQAGR